MYSVNLDSIQDFSQVPVQQFEQNSSKTENASKDFFSMLNENLSKMSEKKEAESVKSNSVSTEKSEQNLNEKSLPPKEVSEKPAEKKSEEVSEKRNSKKPGDENEVAKKEDEGEGKSRGKGLEADSVLQGAVFAKTLGDEKTDSAKNAEINKGKKIASTNVAEKTFLQKSNVEQNAANDFSPEELRIGLAKKNFIDERNSVLNDDENDSELISAEGLLSAMQDNSAKAANVAMTNGGEQNARNVNSIKAKKEGKIGVIEVKDLRTKIEVSAGEGKEIKKDFVKAVNADSEGKIELTMDLGAQTEKNILSLDSQSAAADGSTFQAMLKNQITQNAGDFVRAGNIVLRDNNSGSINLVLHPEELGNVKIGLELSDKIITGHIVVASREAFNAFGDGADVLRNAFIQSGFDDAHFDVTYAGSEMQFAQNQSNQNDGNNSNQHGRKIYGEFVEENVSVVSEIADNYIDGLPANMADYSVDIVA